MIIGLSVSNFRSIDDEVAVSFVASSLKDDETGLIHPPTKSELRLLPSIVFYGPNASGKTNIFKALRFIASSVLHSHSRGEAGDEVPIEPFLGNDTSIESNFEIEFILDEIRYRYGFRCTKKEFLSEWLYSFPKSHPRMLFEREGNNYKFGRHFSGENSRIAKLVRNNSLFASAAKQNSHELMTRISTFFDNFRFFGRTYSHPYSVVHKYKSNDIDQRAIKFLEIINTGVTCFEKKNVQLDAETRRIRDELEGMMKRLIPDNSFTGLDDEDVQIRLGHSIGGKTVYLDLQDESAGTLRTLTFMSDVFFALDNGSLMAIDELDASLHTEIAELVIRLFANKKLNPHGAQLFATTHDTNLLNSTCLRRDQIWLVEKQADGRSEVYPLTDFSTRSNDQLEKGYLQGRFGATHDVDIRTLESALCDA